MKFQANARELHAVVSACAKACAQDSVRPVLECIEIVCQGNTLTLTALNGHMMIQKRMEVTDTRDGRCAINSQSLLRVIARATKDATVACEVVGDKLRVSTEWCQCELPLSLGEFIAHDKLWPEVSPDTHTTIACNGRYLTDAARAVEDAGALVVMEVPHDPVKAITVRSKDGSSRALVLPIRIL